MDQNKKSKPFNRLSPESKKRKKVNMQVKIQVTTIFLMEDMGRKKAAFYEPLPLSGLYRLIVALGHSIDR